jgi:ketosteroid isomerase-like protein
MPVCRCEEIRILHDVPADEYSGHLVREAVGPDSKTIGYRCPVTGRRWKVEFFEDGSGALSMELRQAMTAVELVEWLAIRSDLEEMLDWTHPDVEFNLVGDTTTHRGIDAARRLTATGAARADRPASRALSLIPVSPHEAVVLGDLVFRRDGAAVETRPCAWLVALRDGRISRSRWFASWEEARRAAGLSKHSEHRLIRAGGWLFQVRWPRSFGSAVSS